jgi:hypothetical protein
MERIQRVIFSGEGMGYKRQINARLPETLHKVIATRALEIDETEGGYLATIAYWWLEQGAPPVNAYEARVLANLNLTKKSDANGDAAKPTP